MENENVFFDDSVKLFLFELIDILYNEEYFGHLSTAEKYAHDIRVYFEKHLPGLHKLNLCRKANSFFSRYGENLHVVAYRRSKTKTTWYAFYETFEELYFKITYITNNHAEDAAYIEHIPLK